MDVAPFHDEPGRTILPALRDGRLLGQFTAENIGELLMFRSARSHLASSPPAHGALESHSLQTMAILRKTFVALLGGSLLAVGVAMLFLPGPAVIVIPAALAILSLEFPFARRWRDRFHNHIKSLLGRKGNRP